MPEEMLLDIITLVPVEVLYIFLGAGASFAGSYYLDKRKESRKVDGLRTALGKEIQLAPVIPLRQTIDELYENRPGVIIEALGAETDEVVEWREDIMTAMNECERFHPFKDIYEGNLDKIGTLDEDEIIMVTDYYRCVNGLENKIQRTREAASFEQTPHLDDYQDELESLENELQMLEQQRGRAMISLYHDLDDTDYNEMSAYSDTDEREESGNEEGEEKELERETE